MRKTKFQNDYYYHIYNRGVDKRDIFIDEKDYARFLISMREFNTTEVIDSLYRLKQLRAKVASKSLQISKADCSDLEATLAATSLVKIVCYALLPNHFHILLKQTTENGISKFMHKLGMGYTFYFNTKHNRSGSLFQGTFKSIEAKTDGYLWKLSCYINGNPEIHKISKAENYQWSSYQDYLGLRSGTICDKNVILRDFENIKEYKKLVGVMIKESRQIKDEVACTRLTGEKYTLE